MVQPLLPTPSTIQPDGLMARAGSVSLTCGKHEYFRRILAGSGHPVERATEAAATAVSHPSEKPDPERRSSPVDPFSAALAPEESLSQGRSSDPAEWLSNFNGGGGVPEGQVVPPGGGAASAVRTSSLELSQLVEGWVRRLAVGGDQRRAVARIDIGQGAYAGAELVVVSEAGGISVELALPEGAPSVGLAERLRSRLAARGYTAEVALR